MGRSRGCLDVSARSWGSVTCRSGRTRLRMTCASFGLVLLCMIVGTACHAPKAPLVEASTTGPVVGPWSDAVAGLRTRIAATGLTFQVGEPLPIRLEVESVTEASIEYSAQQVEINEPFVVTRPDGRRIGWAGITRQSASSDVAKIASRKREVLVRGYDLAIDYLICDSGVYTIASRRHSGFPNWPMGAIPGIPASKQILIYLEAGDVPRRRQLMTEIHRRLPVEGHWHLHRNDGPTGSIDKIYCTLTPPGNRIGTSTSAVLSFGRAVPDEELPAALDENGGRRHCLGAFGVQYAYLDTKAETRAAWPRIVEMMCAAIRAVQ